MTDQKQHYDEYILREQHVREWLGINRPQLLESLEENKNFYLFCRLVYAAEDSISFLFGNEKLAFSLISSYHQQSDSGAAQEMHDFMQTLDGIIVTSVIGLVLIFIQVLGAYLLDADDLKENKYKYFFAKVLAPYLRDILQGIKWAYKGMRSVLNTIFYFMLMHKDLILKILFPLSITIAVVSSLNRIFLRTVRNIRKEQQSSNRKRSIEAYEMGHKLKFRKKLPDDKSGELIKLKNTLVYVPEDSNTEDKLYYINNNGKKSEIGLSQDQKANFNNRIRQLQIENICRRLAPEFVQNTEESEQKKELIILYKSDPNFDQIIENNAGNLVYLIDDQANNHSLCKIQNGKLIQDERSVTFASLVQHEIADKNALNLSVLQTNQLVASLDENNFLTTNHVITQKLGASIEDIEEFSVGNQTEITEQATWLVICSFFAVVLSALFDSSYFYMGVLFMANFNPAGFIAMLVMANIMMVVCLFSRLFEEYNYQKIFRVSQIEVRLNTAKTKCEKLLQELEEHRNKSDEDYSPGKEEELLEKLKKSLQEYAQEQQELEKNISMTGFEAFCRGLRNGLSSQGVISSLMFLGTTIMFLAGAPCPPSFLISMMAISFVMMTYSVCRYMLSYQEYEKSKTKYDDEHNNKYGKNIDNQLTNIENLSEEDLIALKNQLDTKIIIRPPELYDEEYCEAFGRLPLSGFYKAEKNYSEFTLGQPRYHESWWQTLISVIFSVGMGVAFLFRGIHKMFSTADGNKNTVDKTALKNKKEGLQFFDKKDSNENPQTPLLSPKMAQNNPNACTIL